MLRLVVVLGEVMVALIFWVVTVAVVFWVVMVAVVLGSADRCGLWCSGGGNVSFIYNGCGISGSDGGCGNGESEWWLWQWGK